MALLGAAAARSALSVLANKDLKEPEVHIVGEIVGISGMDAANAFCVFEVRTGRYWSKVGGEDKGQTQVDYPADDDAAAGGGGMMVWNHPIDLHYFTKTVEGWPRFAFEVWRLDAYGGRALAGYSFVNVPLAAGSHELTCDVWRPCGSQKQELAEYFLDESTHLLDREMVHSAGKAKEERHRVVTKSVGTLHLRLDVVLRHLHDHAVVTS